MYMFAQQQQLLELMLDIPGVFIWCRVLLLAILRCDGIRHFSNTCQNKQPDNCFFAFLLFSAMVTALMLCVFALTYFYL